MIESIPLTSREQLASIGVGGTLGNDPCGSAAGLGSIRRRAPQVPTTAAARPATWGQIKTLLN